jgi:hypothetical protein
MWRSVTFGVKHTALERLRLYLLEQRLRYVPLPRLVSLDSGSDNLALLDTSLIFSGAN